MTKTQHWTLGIWEVTKKSDFWKELANKIDANFKILTTVAKDLNRLELSTTYDNVQIKFTETDTKPLFIECYFNKPIDNLWFEITKSDFIDKLLNLLNKHKLKSANKQLYQKYIIKGDNTQKVREIINNPKITWSILREDITFVGGNQDKNGIYKLEINVNRNVNSLKQLEKIYRFTLWLIDIINGKEQQN